MDFLHRLADRIDLGGGWQSWNTATRAIVVVVAAVLVWGLARGALPALLRLLRPLLIAMILFAVLWLVFPDVVCSMEWTANLPSLCRR
ncbi:MAG TPA: hypothetical protein VMI56_11820 [Reyranella sp.]|nr:hypothetical protein [Reyranella sp.]